MEQLLLRRTSVTVVLCALQLRDLFKVQLIKHFKDPCLRDAGSMCCFWWIQKEEVVGSLPKKVEVRNGLFTQEKKGFKNSQCWKFEAGPPEARQRGQIF